MSTVDEIAHDYLRRNSALDPCAATSRGTLGFDSELTDYSPDGSAARADLARGALRQLQEVGRLEESDRLAAVVMADRLQVEVDLYAAADWAKDLSVFSPMVVVSRVFDLMGSASDADWELLGERLSKVPRTFAGIREALEWGRARGAVADRHQAEISSARARNWAGDGASPGRFRRLAAAYSGGHEALRRRLEEEGAAADRAYLEFAEYLDRDYIASARPEEGCGAEEYQLYCRAYNGTEIDALETYRWGWEELAAIEQEMEATCERILPGAGFAEVSQLLDTDPKRAVEGEERFLAWNQGFLDETVSQLDGVHFAIPEPVRRVEAMLAPPGGSPAMYYTPPSEDFQRPGRTWYPTLGRKHFPLWTEISTAYHEGVPGHHLQLGQVCWMAPRLNPFQGLLGLISGHAEGWALYAERLMGELGYLDNPDYYLGMLANQAFRAARVVVDIGLHHHLTIPDDKAFHPGEVWSRPLAVQFMRRSSGREEAFSVGEVDRYLGTPAQAISYKLGERVWLEVREQARRSWGPAFTLKEFHRRALGLGSVGLQQLREELAKPLAEGAAPA